MSPVRRVRRVIRRIDPWTVLKVSFVFNAIMALAFVLGSIIFWSIFVNAGIPDRLTEFAESLTLSFEVDGELYFRVVLFLSVIWAILMTGLATLGSVLYNLISDTVGGVEVVVLEEVIAPMAAPGGSSAMRPVRRPARQRPAAKQPATPPKAAIAPTPAKVVPTAQPEASAEREAVGDRAPNSDLPTAETRVAP
ncbi:MAG: DUF3566 domain-containing protein [Acidimicrobiia bacterium]